MTTPNRKFLGNAITVDYNHFTGQADITVKARYDQEFEDDMFGNFWSNVCEEVETMTINSFNMEPSEWSKFFETLKKAYGVERVEFI